MKFERAQLDHDLCDSVVMRDMTRIRALLAQGANVNAKDVEHNETPLMLAVKFADAAMIRLLLGAGAEVDARDTWGRTALFYAPLSSEVFRVLLHAGADIHARDKEGNTILMRKVSQSASLADVEELLQLDVDVRARNAFGETALDLAESLGLVNIIERLRSRVT